MDTAREPDAASASRTGARRPLLCAACSARVTWEDQRIPVDGSHEHTRLNPAGVVFRFGCFSSAEGCAVLGEPTLDHTWFTGQAWQYALCRACGAHLGWYFSGGEAFFGLVLARLSAPA